MSDLTPGWDFVGPGVPAWLDVPYYDELQAGPSFLAAGIALAPVLDSYHRIPKTSINDLQERCDKLSDLAHWLTGLPVEPSLQSWRDWLRDVAHNKAAHIGCLNQVLQEGWHRAEKLAHFHTDVTGLSSTRWQPLILTQHRYFCPVRGHHWGDYWVQSLDPSHRHLPHRHREWQDREADPDSLPYVLWLEQHASVLHPHWVRYFSREEQAAARILCRDGLLAKERGRLLSCADKQHFLFVVGLDQQLYAVRNAPQLCHASFTRGQPVLASGVFQAREGRLTHLKFESGHYISGADDWWQAIQLLRERGVAWQGEVRVTVWDRHAFVSRKLNEAALASREAFLAGLRLPRQ